MYIFYPCIYRNIRVCIHVCTLYRHHQVIHIAPFQDNADTKTSCLKQLLSLYRPHFNTSHSRHLWASPLSTSRYFGPILTPPPPVTHLGTPKSTSHISDPPIF